MIHFHSFLILSEYCLSLMTSYIYERKKTFCFLGYLKVLPQCCTWDVPALLRVTVKLIDSSHQAPFPTAAGGKPCPTVRNKGTSSPSTALEKNTPAGTCATGVTQLCLYMVGFSLRDLMGTTLAPFFSPQQYKWVQTASNSSGTWKQWVKKAPGHLQIMESCRANEC